MFVFCWIIYFISKNKYMVKVKTQLLPGIHSCHSPKVIPYSLSDFIMCILDFILLSVIRRLICTYNALYFASSTHTGTIMILEAKLAIIPTFSFSCHIFLFGYIFFVTSNSPFVLRTEWPLSKLKKPLD